MAKKRKKNEKIKEKNVVRLTPSQEKERAAIMKWEPSHKMGKVKYILIKGTLAWSVMTTGLFVLLTLITNKFTVNQEILLYFLKMFVVFVGMGTIFGMVTWHFSEKKYALLKEELPIKNEKK